MLKFGIVPFTTNPVPTIQFLPRIVPDERNALARMKELFLIEKDLIKSAFCPFSSSIPILTS